ncbi:MAG TPA: anti-sigma factor [Acidimicrobiales bacterium]|jgi:anti-sigma-K factor RskA|nr:anti-sigma factor [Acidimicrobiales bacterium]
MTHDEASDLLGAYALDAVDGSEFTDLEEHLETCPRCRAELDSLRDVAAAMGNSVEPLPEGLWSQIAVRLPERQEDEEPPPMPRLTPEGSSPFRSPASHAASTRRRRTTLTTVGAIAVAAAAVAIVLGIGLVRADNRVSNLQSAQAAPTAAVKTALNTPGHRVVTLDSSTHAEQAQVVVLPSGQGYVVSSTLPSLDKGRTYQLWEIEGNQPISLGLLGGSPGRAAFTMAGSTRPSHLSITAEPAGGSVFPTGPILATGTV